MATWVYVSRCTIPPSEDRPKFIPVHIVLYIIWAKHVFKKMKGQILLLCLRFQFILTVRNRDVTVLCYTRVLEQTSLWTDSKLVKLWGGVAVLCTSVRCLLWHLLPKVDILTWDGVAWLEQAFNSKNIPPYHSYSIFICHVNIGWRPVSSLKHGWGSGRGLATHVCLRWARTAVNDWSAAFERESRLTRSRSILYDACFSRACTGL